MKADDRTIQSTGLDFQKSTQLPGFGPSQNLKFEREDWTTFRTVEGLQQKAGVAADKLRRLVLKELTDNALDTGQAVRIGELPDGGYFVEDDGPGIDGDAGRDRAPVQHRPADGLDQAVAAADARRARQRSARGRGCGARIGRLARRHHPQSPDRTAP